MPTRVEICIQARQGSSRMPGKSTKILGENGSIISYMLATIKHAIQPLKGNSTPFEFEFGVNLLVPETEFEFWKEKYNHNFDMIFGGEMDNVLSRFLFIHQTRKPKYVVRLTADCPLIPQSALNRAIYQCCKHRLDYLCNSWENIRTTADGHDVEIMSSDAMEWLSQNAKDQEDFEHVTIAIRKHVPPLLRIGVLMTKEDNSHIKCSIDTQDDFDAVNKRLKKSFEKRKMASEMGFGVYDY